MPPPDPLAKPWRRLYAATSTEEVDRPDICGGDVAVWTQVHPTRGSDNEDAALIASLDDRGALLAVADGFGGAPAGERAAKLALTALDTSFGRAAKDGVLLRTAILDGFETANRKVLDLGLGAATTLVAVGIEDGFVRPFHAGDSTILLVGGRGKVKWKSLSHSPAGYALESGWVKESEALGHDEAHLVSNYVGSAEMRIEIGPKLKLAPRDTLLLASDGLTDNLGQDQTVAALTDAPTLAAAVTKLADKASARMTQDDGKPDDLTLIAFRPRPKR